MKAKESVTVHLSKKRIQGLRKLAEIWGLTPEEALCRLLDKVIEESL